MKADNFVLDDYLKRTNATEKPNTSLDSIRSLMTQQLHAIPFENLDVQSGKAISMVPEDIVQKLVYKKRGGYCYEVNGLFAMALESLGVTYKFVAVRPMFYPVKRPKTHMALVVNLEGNDWLLDLGFGSYGIKQPICLSAVGQEIEQGYDVFRLTKMPSGEYLLQAKIERKWTNQYSFDHHAVDWIDFIPANYLNSTHPDAIFVQKRMLTLRRLNRF